MKEFSYVITDPEGMHIRPAGMFVKIAEGFKCNITIGVPGRDVDAKRIMRVMGLGIMCGAEVFVKCEGSDEDAAVEALKKFFEENM